MNGKQAKRLRKMAIQTATALADGIGSKDMLQADPTGIYKELKKIHNEFGCKGDEQSYAEWRAKEQAKSSQ